MSTCNRIDMLRKRPEMYLGSRNITALFHFLGGYRMAESDLGLDFQRELFPLDFCFINEFVNFRLGCENNMGWCKNILNYCGGDEEKAFSVFFDIYDNFKNITMKRYYKAILSEDNIQYNNCMKHSCKMGDNGKEPVFKNPSAVYVIELDISFFIAAVETDTYVKLEPMFFKSFEDAVSGRIPFGVETYFGKISAWKEYIDGDIKFNSLCYKKTKTSKRHTFPLIKCFMI